MSSVVNLILKKCVLNKGRINSKSDFSSSLIFRFEKKAKIVNLEDNKK